MKTLGPCDIDLSRLNPTPHAIAVYASSPLSPVATQHSLPSGRYPLLGPDFHRPDRTSLRLAHSFDHLVGHHFASAESQLRDVEEAARGLALKISDLAREGQSHSSSDRRLSANSRNSKIADRGVRASSNSQMGGDRPADDDGPPVAGGLRVGRQGRSGSREAPTLCDEKNPCALHRFRCPFQDGLEECLPRC